MVGDVACVGLTPFGTLARLSAREILGRTRVFEVNSAGIRPDQACWPSDHGQAVSASPYRSLADLVRAARNRPGELTMAFQGPGTGQHVAFEKFKRVANIDMIQVPFTGAAPAVSALLGGHVTSLFANYPSAVEQIRSGQLRALAFASAARTNSAPDVPTIAELGFAQYEEEDVWFGVVAPARTSRGNITQLATWLRRMMQAPGTEARLATLELYPTVLCGEEFAEFLRHQRQQYQHIVRESKMKAE